MGQFDHRPAPAEDVKEVEMMEGRNVKIGTSLTPEDEEKLVGVLKDNVSAFAWHSSDMPGIDPDFLCHRLAIDPSAKAVIQKRRKFGEEKRRAITEETRIWVMAGHVQEIQYPTWLANVVMVRKSSGKWRMCTDFTDLNKACPKDSYPLPNIDCLVDGASGYELLSFMDAYSGYNQIRMHPANEDKTAFIADQANFCYRVMSFGLKNAGATYQRLMDKVLVNQLGRNVEAYVDDMVVKSESVSRHFDDLQEMFDTIGKYQLKLNPEKCSFGVQAGKFLSFLLTHRGIEANPDKCSAIINMRSPSTVKEVQQLTGRMASLSRFLSRSADKVLPLFQCLKKNDRFAWTTKCEEAFTELKRSLASPPILTKPLLNLPLLVYILASDRAVSFVLVQEREGSQAPIYFVSRVLQGAETRYQKIEKLALAILVTARKLRHYFQSYEVIICTDYSIRQVLQKLDLAGRMMKWSVELSEFSIKYEPRGASKAQALADFLMELTHPAEEHTVGETQWILSVDGASNLGGNGAGIVLEGPGGILLEQSLRFEFRASNNQAEYKALLAGMSLAKEMGATSLSARSDSHLITGQVAGTFQAKDPQLAKYLEKVKLLSENFREFTLNHVPREQNSWVDLLSKLASTKKPGATRSVIQETLTQPSINTPQGSVLFIQEELDSWMGPYIAYLTRGEVLEDKKEASLIQRESARFVVINERLYRRGFSSPLLRCLTKSQAQRVMDEVHGGMCGSHIGGRALVYKVARAGYFWPNLRNDCVNWVQKCDGCQRHATLPPSPAERLPSILSPWPFNKWGIDILGPFSIAVRQLKFLIVDVDYFSKWIEAEPIATISVEKVRAFLWKNVVCRYGVPQVLVSDNGTQFASARVRDFCR
uniref:Retrovirus-related Pol polyprotein from transposon 297 family n=2 Tax=Cajanus cajan TaxID=3821 RepID=A0A151RG42_CAJCA|nr:Retrovirus-related Pol polyprotein from transposon 297 family [Cajanus cajan]